MTFIAYIKQKLVYNALFYKKGSMTFFSIWSSLVISFSSLKFQIQDQYMGISTTMIMLLSALILFDSLTGISASKHEGEKIQSGKLQFTFYKFLLSFLFFWIMSEISKNITGRISVVKSEYLLMFYKTANEVFEIVTYSILTLLMFREWLSIGENIERRYKKKYYLFTLVDKIFDILEKKLFSWIDESICKNEPKPTDNINNENIE